MQDVVIRLPCVTKLLRRAISRAPQIGKTGVSAVPASFDI
jgi:hypothetical protein